MNKGPPAGNVLRRQISLLPKYQLLMTPIDETSVTIQLKLLNQSFLAENIENLTAGGTHKGYIVVGDSTNRLLLLASFKDTDLLGVFGGTMTHVIKRQHNCEHKIFAHCISSSFVGLDVQSEYVFKDLNKFFGSPNRDFKINEKITNDTPENESLRKRSRNKSADADKNQCKGKKKRETAVIKNFEYLKNKFEADSQVIQENYYLNSNHNENVNHNEIRSRLESVSKDNINTAFSNISQYMNLVLDADDSNYINNDENINKILNEIEKEMSKNKNCEKRSTVIDLTNYSESNNSRNLSSFKYEPMKKKPFQHKQKIRKPVSGKTNYTFIDLLERKGDCSDDNYEIVKPSTHQGFTDSVKDYINQFILKARTANETHDSNLHSLLNEDKTVSENKEYLKHSNKIEKAKNNSEKNLPTHKPCPYYEIKEILDRQRNMEGTEINSSSRDLITKCPLNINTNDNETRAISNNTGGLVFMHSNAVKESYNQNHSNPLNSIVNDISSKPNKSDDAYESNLDKSHVDCRESAMEANTDISLENVLNCNDNSVKIKETTSKQETTLPFTQNSLNTTKINHKTMFIPEDNNLCVMSVTSKPYKCNIVDASDSKIVQQNIQSTKEISNKNCCIPNSLMINYDQKVVTANYFPNSASYQLVNETTAVNNTDKQNIFKPIFTNNNSHTKPIKCNRSKAYFNGNEKEYVKKYYYSTRDVNMETRELKDCNIRIIKEIKMDLNITAIISTAKQNDSVEESDIINTNNINECENNSSPMSTHENKQNNDYINQATKQQNTNQPNKTVFQEHASSNRAAKYTENMFIDSNYSNYQEMKSIQPISDLRCNLRQDTKLNNTFDNKLNDGSGHLNDVKQMTMKPKENDYIVKTPPNGIRNILQKYSKILGKEVIKDQPSAYQAPDKNTVNKRTPSKSKKPFQIRNIKHLQATVPETIIHHSEQNQHEYQEIPVAMKTVRNVSKINEETKCDNIKSQEHSINNWGPYQHTTDVDMEQQDILEEINLDPDIDQSMFDPKTLLQCTFDTDSKEIYTPPPQFCDFNTSDSDTDEPDIVVNSGQLDESQIAIDTITEFNWNRNEVEDFYTSNLTPSKEIETWVLNEPECQEGENLSSSLSTPKSFTVLRRNNLKRYNPSEGNVNDSTRKTVLKKFKFTPKSKLKK